MLEIKKISKEFDKDLEKIIRDCLIEYNLNISGTAWEDPYLHKFSEYYKDIKGNYYIAFWNGELAGGCGYGPLPGETDTCELQKLYIKKELRKYGIGQALVNAVEKEASNFYQKIYLETAESMESAIRFYKKNNYKLLCSPLGNTGHNSCGTFFMKELK